ncbi:hypothetical protein BGZ99_008221 [Dissophora globulifera]|uniref:G-patch domain-containing protein n=1 Tax=Dissophora globulifera TaxID=979702 RepID=A0A9P6RBT8_9FUNG|nr:hypothetical protein BGZ99_008221 [Dissophora globulifera]
MSDESFVLVGTPMPVIKTTTNALGESKRINPTRDLEVRDEQGRRRFHGAFTGGFSAGYYNTVGSKEGWAPSEFVSSRDKRSEKKIARPEDFMDEEDKQMLMDSARLTTTDEFGSSESTQRELEKKRAAAKQAAGGVLGALPDTLIDDFVVPSSENVGVKLLRRMGWKPGQGIGPRVTKRQKKSKDGQLSDDDVDLPANMTFAPIDSAIVVFINKSDNFGLGYDPYKDAPEFDRSLQARTESKYLSESAGGRKDGMGFGRFDDDDDDDVYGSGPAPLRTLDPDLILDDRSRSQRKKSKKKEIQQSDALAPMFCSDGRPPLRGFVLAAAPLEPIKLYKPPKVPRDFVPHHTFQDMPKPVATLRKNEQPKLTADDRALILGETPIDAPRRSVFEYMSAQTKRDLDNALGFVMDTEGDKSLRKDHWTVPQIDKGAAEAALRGFMPFGDNMAKQNRYKQYLNVQAGISDEKIDLVEGFTAEGMTKELNEFVQAARIFKPLTSSMANRFMSASTTVQLAPPTAGLRSAADTEAARLAGTITHAVVERMEVPKSQAAKAAAMGMFGPLTRTVIDFYPVKLLCKRFNVPNPHPDHKDTGPEAAKDLLDKDTMDKMMTNRRYGEGMSAEDATSRSSGTDAPGAMNDTGTDSLAEAEEPEVLEVIPERPPMDIFKAIFDDSDSDSDSDSESEDKDESDTKGEAARGKDTVSIGATAIADSSPLDAKDAKEDSPQVPFRPVFTRKTDRSTSSTTSRPAEKRFSKPDLSHLNEDEDEDESEIGPKLAIPSASNLSVKKKSVSLVDNAGVGGVAAVVEASSPDRSSSPSSDSLIGPVPPTLVAADAGKRRKSASESDQDSHVGEKTGDSFASKRHKGSASSSSRHKSSSSKLDDRTDRHSRSSHSRHRSSSKTRRRPRNDGSDDDNDGNKDGSDTDKSGASGDEESNKKRRKEHSSSTSSRHKDRQHREHTSRSRSKSPTSSRRKSHRRDKDKGDDRERQSKRSRDEKSSRSTHRSSRHRSRKHGDDGDNDEDMEDLWVEKEVKIPERERTPDNPPLRVAPPSNRPRATSFF